jgi:hypothetical protein
MATTGDRRKAGSSEVVAYSATRFAFGAISASVSGRRLYAEHWCWQIRSIGHVRAYQHAAGLQREGVARAGAEGKYKGADCPRQGGQRAAVGKKGQTRDAIAADHGIGVASVYRILAEARATGAIAA